MKGLVATPKRIGLQGLKLLKLKVPRKARENTDTVDATAPESIGMESVERLIWQVTERKGNPLIHIIADGSPRCWRRQRKDASCKFKNCAAEGDTVQTLELMRFRMRDRCDRCWQRADARERQALGRALLSDG